MPLRSRMIPSPRTFECGSLSLLPSASASLISATASALTSGGTRSSRPPRVDERPQPDCQERAQQDQQGGIRLHEREGIGWSGARPQPGQNDPSDEEDDRLDRLTVVELAEAGKDAR